MSIKRIWLGSLMGLMVVVATAAAQDAPETTTAAENKTETTTTRPPLTGNPQIDYKYDPNLPHELLGYDLSDYPFYARLPPDLLDPNFNFTCDNRHDGFYASVPHKCQVYHNCLFGQRYDFLCANYTVFDQKNFICHYVSEVDCVNSEKHYDRNDELYETTTTTTTTPPPPQIIYVERPRPLANRLRPNMNRPQRPSGPRPGKRPGKRRPSTTTPPPEYDYDYYYDQYYDQYYDDYYNDYANERTTTTTTTTTQRPRRPGRPQRTRLGTRNNVEDRSRPSGRFGGVFNVRDRKRPRINPPVPQDAAEEEFRPRASRLQQDGPQRRQNQNDDGPGQGSRPQGSGQRRRRIRPSKKTTTTTTTTEAAPDYYYDDYYEYYDDEPSSTTTTTTTAAPSRPSRPRQGSRGRPRRPEATTPSTTTTSAPEEPLPQEPSGGRDSRPGRVNVRKGPVGGRRPAPTPVEEDQPAEPQEAAPAPQRRRPSFPRRRQQSEPEVVLEDAPLAPEIVAAPEEDFAEESPDVAPSGGARRRPGLRRPIRRGSGVRGGGASQSSSPDYYDY
ncbi:proteoglycan 4-like [Penaeus monodon]|uniref:proteoglycan 4-like n=1 Tax=Penaeus monodon TaxID=6687 RepID=UPI0018A76B5E|nr:proteoglycan 4-like [Penaeus monodon]XP_037783143.1 proteoglycan 4-like [Penaeus monodon]XP_037783144.1 proteoglycan 4-like [Penaeus monodon]XP_037783145.1 proteoglycan 4-like [Penaeus monodon]